MGAVFFLGGGGRGRGRSVGLGWVGLREHFQDVW